MADAGVLYIGALEHADEGEARAEGSTHVDATPVPFLICCERWAEGEPRPRPLPWWRAADGGAGDTTGEMSAAAAPAAAPSAPLAGDPSASPPKRKKRKSQQHWNRKQHLRAYYVCTRTGCGWSGSAISRHATARPECPYTPCAMTWRAGEDLRARVADFLRRCTPAQREAGLPPDGERAVPCAGGDGALYCTVPDGLVTGDTFLVDRGGHARHRLCVTVTDEMRPGAVIAIQPPGRNAAACAGAAAAP